MNPIDKIENILNQIYSLMEIRYHGMNTDNYTKLMFFIINEGKMLAKEMEKCSIDDLENSKKNR